MKFHEILRARRQALGLTQEQLARRLGVSAPAVNKWERANTYPDVTLLPPLARLLGVDLNTLLSFQEELTDREIGDFANRLMEQARTHGCAAAFDMARDKLREYPNSGMLAYTVAGLLDGARMFWPGEDPEQAEGWSAQVLALYEQAAQSADPEVSGPARIALLSRSMAAGDFDRAEELLAQLPAAHRSRGILEASLRKKQGRGEEAEVLLERELFNQAHSIQSTLLSLIELALEEGDGPRAHLLSQTAQEAGRVFHLWGYAASGAPFQVAVAEQDGPTALEVLEEMLHSLTDPWVVNASPLYRRIPPKDGSGEGQSMLLPLLLDELERDPECAFLREQPGYRPLVERYR